MLEQNKWLKIDGKVNLNNKPSQTSHTGQCYGWVYELMTSRECVLLLEYMPNWQLQETPLLMVRIYLQKTSKQIRIKLMLIIEIWLFNITDLAFLAILSKVLNARSKTKANLTLYLAAGKWQTNLQIGKQ